jgi:hypothetical protein
MSPIDTGRRPVDSPTAKSWPKPGTREEKQAPSSDAVVMERLTQLERKVDALCRYLLGRTALSRAGRSHGLVKSAE